MENKKFRKLTEVQAEYAKKKEKVKPSDSETDAEFAKVDISRAAAASLQAGMTEKELKIFIQNMLHEEPPDWLMEKIREKRKIIKESTSSRALGF